ncbi:hypothetical protein [Nocardia sp. NPDC051463]|uniref:hypothetical protein n=1 Tax=Nocardia sp. NPDC051463 TaxID=3154845 RepID=UPI00343F2960
MVVQTAMSLGSSALQIASMLWQGQGASAAAKKSQQAASDATAVSAQSAHTSVGVTAAAGSVFQGATAMSAVIAKFMTSLAASVPFLPTPPGQMFLVALTTETLAEATAVIAKTRGELTVHSGAMTKTGAKVPVTGAPKNVDPTQAIQQLMQLVQPLTQLATSGGQALQAAQTALYPARAIADKETDEEKARREAELGGAGGGSFGAGGGGGGAVSVGGQARQLTPWNGPRAGTAFGAAGTSTPAVETATATQAAAVRGMGSSSPSMMPMGGAAGAAGMARSEEQSTDGLRGLLVTEQHGNEVVGDVEGVSMPVVGAAEHVSGPLDSDSPDKSLTL